MLAVPLLSHAVHLTPASVSQAPPALKLSVTEVQGDPAESRITHRNYRYSSLRHAAQHLSPVVSQLSSEPAHPKFLLILMPQDVNVWSLTNT